MEMVRTVVVNAYQAARLRGEGYVTAFEKALAMYRELSPQVASEDARAEVERLLSLRLPTDSDLSPLPREIGSGREPVLASLEITELRRRLDMLERRQDDFDRALVSIQQDTGETRQALASISSRLDRLVAHAEASAAAREEQPHTQHARREREQEHRDPGHRDYERSEERYSHGPEADMRGPVPVWVGWPMWTLWLWSYWLGLMTGQQPRR